MHRRNRTHVIDRRDKISLAFLLYMVSRQIAIIFSTCAAEKFHKAKISPVYHCPGAKIRPISVRRQYRKVGCVRQNAPHAASRLPSGIASTSQIAATSALSVHAACTARASRRVSSACASSRIATETSRSGSSRDSIRRQRLHTKSVAAAIAQNVTSQKIQSICRFTSFSRFMVCRAAAGCAGKQKALRIFPKRFPLQQKAILITDIWQQCNVSCTLNGSRQLTLMECTCAGYSARQNLCALCHALSQSCNVLIIDALNVINTEHTNLSARSFFTLRSFSLHTGRSSYLQCGIFEA